MDLSLLINEQIISLKLNARTKEEAIKKIAEKMKESGYISNIEKYMEAVLKREEKGSTGIGFSLAIPHGKSEGVNKPALGFAKLVEPIDWQSLDGNPVKMLFVIAVPIDQAGDEHLKILSSISRKLIHEDFRNQLIAASSSQEIINILKSID